MALKLRKLSFAPGAEVCGVDVSRPMSESTFGEICQAFLANGIHLSGTRKLANDTTGVVRAEEQKRINPPVAQPVVRVHPETGRKALYIGEKVKRFDGMTEEESQPLIDYLVRHATRPEFLYRHQWRKNDILAWDNRCVMHQALGDFDETQLRHMERTTILGTPSGYVVN